ncbi:helix-turn-helix transcriptional regulator [Bengtsoniella intestinalis]|uniref:helix-turn-helix domain-containing protein n=1 Tax=Bengtsoniella intestinalis TaxID=3073143 RepID=UPI00391F676E
MYKHLRAMHEDRDLNQTQMAELLCVAQTTYSDYERGIINIPVGILKQLAEHFNTSVDYLLDMTEETKPYPRRKE